MCIANESRRTDCLAELLCAWFISVFNDLKEYTYACMPTYVLYWHPHKPLSSLIEKYTHTHKLFEENVIEPSIIEIDLRMVIVAQLIYEIGINYTVERKNYSAANLHNFIILDFSTLVL